MAAEAKVEQAQSSVPTVIGTTAALSTIGNTGAASKSEQDKAFADTQNNLALLQQAQANVSVAKEALKTAQVAETGLKAQVTNAAAQLDQAKTTKNYSSIIAPMDGQLVKSIHVWDNM